MTTDEIIKRLRAETNLKHVSDELKIPYATLHRWYSGQTKNPGSLGLDKLRSYYESRA